MPSFAFEKSVSGSCSRSHSKFGETAGMQCFCNALLAVSWAKFHKVLCWYNFDLDFLLDLVDNLYKSLGLRQHLDASDLPEHIRFHGNFWTIDKTCLNDGEGIIGTRFLFNPLLPRSRNSVLLFINSTIKGIISHSYLIVSQT